MLRVLAGFTLLLTGADHWTTYVCLRGPIAGWEITEANPLADWLFEITGLIPGLAIDTFVTLLAIGFLTTTPRFGPSVKCGLLGFISLTTGYAVLNNLNAMSELGLWPMGAG